MSVWRKKGRLLLMNDDIDKATELTIEDIDIFVAKLMNGDYDIKMRLCFKCSKDFIPNYHDFECDECYFSKWPEEERKRFFRSFFE
jgi:hypothetical protein